MFYSVGLSIVRSYKLNKTLKSSIKLCTRTKTLIKNILLIIFLACKVKTIGNKILGGHVYQ